MSEGLFGVADGARPDANPGEEVAFAISVEVVSPKIDN